MRFLYHIIKPISYVNIESYADMIINMLINLILS